MLEKLKNKMDLLVKKTGRIMVSDDIRDNRLATCNSCPYRIESVNLCSKCGCFIPAKTKLAGAGCPIGKWQAVILDNK
jgi:Family of unknown function (DUF6171)